MRQTKERESSCRRVLYSVQKVEKYLEAIAE